MNRRQMGKLFNANTMTIPSRPQTTDVNYLEGMCVNLNYTLAKFGIFFQPIQFVKSQFKSSQAITTFREDLFLFYTFYYCIIPRYFSTA